jgi:hypothetical protein
MIEKLNPQGFGKLMGIRNVLLVEKVGKLSQIPSIALDGICGVTAFHLQHREIVIDNFLHQIAALISGLGNTGDENNPTSAGPWELAYLGKNIS